MLVNFLNILLFIPLLLLPPCHSIISLSLLCFCQFVEYLGREELFLYFLNEMEEPLKEKDLCKRSGRIGECRSVHVPRNRDSEVDSEIQIQAFFRNRQ